MLRPPLRIPRPAHAGWQLRGRSDNRPPGGLRQYSTCRCSTNYTGSGHIMTVRTLFIGMDGATFTVLNDLTKNQEGGPIMPFLASIFARGARAKLRSTPNPLTPPAW